MTDNEKKGRVSRPELKAMIAYINKYSIESGIELSFPLPKERSITFLQYNNNRYSTTHHFDYPKPAKEFLIQLMNDLIAKHGLKVLMAGHGEVTLGIPPTGT